MKYKYVIYDIEGLLIDSKNDYDEIFDTYEEAEKECFKALEEIEESCKKEHEDSFLAGYNIEKVK